LKLKWRARLQLLARDTDIVLDPWNGSGTTTLVAQKLGIKSFGLEINPVMTIHARAKNLRLVSQAEQVKRLARALVSRASRDASGALPEVRGIGDWVHKEPLAGLLALRTAICGFR
jgi:hypothetical protein